MKKKVKTKKERMRSSGLERGTANFQKRVASLERGTANFQKRVASFLPRFYSKTYE